MSRNSRDVFAEFARQNYARASTATKTGVNVPLLRDRHGVLHFSTVSDGTSAAGWVARLANKGIKLEENAKRIVKTCLKPTREVFSDVAIFDWTTLSAGKYPIKTARRLVNECGWPHGITTPEDVCLARFHLKGWLLRAHRLDRVIALHPPVEGRILGLEFKDGIDYLTWYPFNSDAPWDKFTGILVSTSKVEGVFLPHNVT